MTIMVTGGAGFIGGHVGSALLDRGADVTILDNLSSASLSAVPPAMEFIHADVADPTIVDLIVRTSPQVIVHAAAQASVPRSMADPAHDRAVNVVGTEHIIRAARQLERCRIVFLSTGGAIYGETAVPASEDALPRPKSFYGAHKYLAERYLEYSGVSYAIARLANVYGPGQRSDLEGGVAAIFAERLSAGQDIVVYGDGSQRRDFIHVLDVVEAVLTMVNTDRCGLWNVGTGTETTVTMLLELLQHEIRPARTVHHQPAREGDVYRSCLAIDRIKTDLGWAPAISIEEGVRGLA